MRLRNLCVALAKRIVLMLLAGLVLVLLAHVESGTRPELLLGIKAHGWWAEDWIGHTTSYLKSLTRGEFGTVSLRTPGYTYGEPVTAVLRRYGPNSLALLLGAMGVSLVGGTLAGIMASRFGPRAFRLAAISSTMLVLSVPDVLIVLLLHRWMVWMMSAFGVQLFTLSSPGAGLTASQFVAPVLALSALPLGLVARLAAVAFDEVYDQLYIRTALAKGLRPLRVVLVHALKNAWIRVAEAWPLVMSGLVSGLVIVEQMLRFPGIGRTIGLMLEEGGQSAALSSIVLTLLLLAMALDLIMNGVRLALDPRLAEQRATTISPGCWEPGFRLTLPGPGAVGRGLRAAMAEWQEGLRQWLWRNRPSRVFALIVRNPLLLIGLIGVGLLLFVALFGAQFVELEQRRQLIRYLVVDGKVIFPPYPPGTEGFPLGSDMAGRSVLTRLLIGARSTLFFTLAVTPVRFLFALPWGLAAGLRRGLWATAAEAFSLMLSAVPAVLIPAMLIITLIKIPIPTLQGRFWLITIILALVGIPRLADLIRRHVEAIAVQPYLEGARAVGASDGRILWRHIFPHLTPHLWVAAAADMAWTLLLLAQFGVFSIYLGGSINVSTGYEILHPVSRTVTFPRIPDWSSMLSKPYEVIYQAPWALWYPALAFLLAIMAFNLVAEGLRRGSQRMTASVAVEEEAVPVGRRRLAVEWGATAVALLLMLTFTTQYLLESRHLYQAAQAQPTLEQARLRVEAVLHLAGSEGALQQQASAMVYEAVEQYLIHSLKAGLSAAEIEQQSQQRLKAHQLDGFTVATVEVQSRAGATTTHLFVLDHNAADVAYATLAIRPESVAVIRREGRDRWLILTGKDPETGTPAVNVWAGPDASYLYPRRYTWRIAPVAAERLIGVAPVRFQAVGAKEEHRVVALDPLRELRVDPAGNLTLCPGSTAPCQTLLWKKEGGWAPPS